MRVAFRIIGLIFTFIFLTALTQIGGVLYLLSYWLCYKVRWKSKYRIALVFNVLYLMATFIVVPALAPLFGRERLKNTENIKAATYISILFNRNYVVPEMNDLLAKTASQLEGSGIQITYLDANFPFINKFPLLPHLSHNDGKKLDVSLVYETKEGAMSKKQKSNSGYGVFAVPRATEHNQIRDCIRQGYFQYDYPKYLTLGTKNDALIFSEKGTKKLIRSFLKEQSLKKLFIEPHLKKRLNLTSSRVRYHGCRAVRHDDHIHLELK